MMYWLIYATQHLPEIENFHIESTTCTVYYVFYLVIRHTGRRSSAKTVLCFRNHFLLCYVMSAARKENLPSA